MNINEMNNSFHSENDELSQIEKNILLNISEGKTYKNLSLELMLSEDEIKKIIRNIYRKLQKR